MQISYQKDFNQNCLIIRSEQEIPVDSYPVRMLLGNEVPGLLPCRIQSVDGKYGFYYDVAGCQPLRPYLCGRKLRGEDLRKLLEGFVKTVESIRAYLLDARGLVVNAEYIYYNRERDALQFCYFPGCDRDIGEQFQSFLEDLLPLVDHQDSAGVMMAYGIYRQMMEQNFHIDCLKELIYRDYGTDVEEPGREPRKEEEAERERQKVMDEFFESEDGEIMDEKTKIPWDAVLFGCIWSAALLGVCVLRCMGYLSFLTMPMLLGVVLVFLGLGGINLLFWKKSRKEKSPAGGPAKWTESSMAQASIQWPGKQVADPEEIAGMYREEQGRADTYSRPAPDNGDTQPMPKLDAVGRGKLVSSNPGSLPDICLSGDLTIIGKMEGAVDARISLPTVSRVHAKIRKVDGEYYVTDLDSRNGTYLNGELLPNQENRRICPGDALRFADAEYIFAL